MKLDLTSILLENIWWKIGVYSEQQLIDRTRGKGSSINDVTQEGGGGIFYCVTLSTKLKVKQSFECDRRGRGVNFRSNLRDIIYK